jgi:hypothetical protein
MTGWVLKDLGGTLVDILRYYPTPDAERLSKIS